MLIDWLMVLLGVVLTAGTAIFVAAEFSLVAMDPATVDRRVAAGDRAAFADLYDAVAPRMFGLVRRVVRDPSIAEVSLAEFRRVFDTNASGPAVLTRALLPSLRAGRLKRIVNISSTLGSIETSSNGFSVAYRASKAALNMITVATHQDLAKDGFTVVTMCPGWNRTDMGGAEAPLDPSEGVAGVLAVESRLTPADSGKFLSHEGKIVPW